MARYIDANKLYTKVKEKTNPYGKPTLNYESGVKVLDMIKNQPTADVAEVKHGEWVKKHGIYVCSECDWTCPYDVVADDIDYWECQYCRHCGAKMDGERRDT